MSPNKKKIKVLQYGFGPIGQETVRAVLKKEGLELIGVVDINPKFIGKDVGEILGEKKLGIIVKQSLAEALNGQKADIALHTTTSFVKSVKPQLEELIRAGINVVSSTEELLIPHLQSPEEAKEIDELAKAYNVTILGTGVNPGFVMDTLPLFLSSTCLDVKKIEARREVDAGTRRLPLQKKVGAGLDVDDFKKLAKEKKLGHIGLIESIALIAEGLGWKLDDIQESVEPVIADKDCKTKYLEVRKGQAAGLKHVAKGFKNKEELIQLDLRMYVGAKEPFDYIHIIGTPEIKCKFEGGIAGDQATVASLINSIPRVLKASPGLVTMYKLPIPYALINSNALS